MSEFATIAEIGEKEVIERYLRPLFNPDDDLNSIGDDCAALEFPHGSLALFSTDRVPADLISFRAGVLDYFGVGRYLAVLNISDIAACGGLPQALLLNFGLPSDLPISVLLAVCDGVMSILDPLGVKVMGGDMTFSAELSISATAFGYVEKDRILRRSGARPGDSIFVSREMGMTPVALHYCLNPRAFEEYEPTEITALRNQFTAVTPMIELGRRLAVSGRCSSAMDNTDGLSQSLSELSRESESAFVVDRGLFDLSLTVQKFARQIASDPITVAFGPGADFSLVGTLAGDWSTGSATTQFGHDIRIIGHIVDGSGVLLKSGDGIVPFEVPGWNYFCTSGDRKSDSMVASTTAMLEPENGPPVNENPDRISSQITEG